MKKILSLILILVSINLLGQDFPGYTFQSTPNYRHQFLGALQSQRGFINAVYVDTTAANAGYINFHDGAQIWTSSDKNFWLWDSVFNKWTRMAKYSEVGGVNIYNTSAMLEGDRIVSGNAHAHGLLFDSLEYFRINRNNVTRFEVTSGISKMASVAGDAYAYATTGEAGLWNDNSNMVVHNDDSIIFNSVGSVYQFRNIPYNSDPDLISIVYDSTNGRLYRQIISGGGGSQTLQQVFDTEVGGSVLTKTDTILTGSNYLRVTGTGTSYSLLATNSSSGAAINAINFSTGSALVGNGAGSGLGIRATSSTGIAAEFQSQASTGSDIITVANYNAISQSTVGANGIGGQINYNVESTTTQPAEAAKFQYYYTDATHATRTVRLNWLAYNAGAEENFMQVQPGGIVIVNNLTDTLATLQDVRDGGGGGGGIDSVVLRNDTLFYYVGATPTTITPVIPYDFTSLADGDLLKYDAGSSSFINTKTIEGIRWIPRQDSAASSATPTINTDNVDIYKLTAQAADITSFTTNLSGTPRHGEILEIQITGTAARAITWGSAFVSSTVTLPTTTSSTATLTVILQYYTNSSYGNFKWVCVNYY